MSVPWFDGSKGAPDGADFSQQILVEIYCLH
jgi:hypothetical protein